MTHPRRSVWRTGRSLDPGLHGRPPGLPRAPRSCAGLPPSGLRMSPWQSGGSGCCPPTAPPTAPPLPPRPRPKSARKQCRPPGNSVRKQERGPGWHQVTGKAGTQAPGPAPGQALRLEHCLCAFQELRVLYVHVAVRVCVHVCTVCAAVHDVRVCARVCTRRAGGNHFVSYVNV